jgi:adenosylcobinamide kinase / adenosylcobinamide-phosphate guanylyltransferase
LIFLLGGARSGKSSVAVSMASRIGQPVRFLATARPDDDEMTERIAQHRGRRPESWTVAEAPIEVPDALRAATDDETVVLDCVTLWISNLMVEHDDETIGNLVEEAVDACRRHPGQVIVVSNEVGAGLVPMDPVGRRFRDLQGGANQTFADAAEVSYLLVAGKTLRLGDIDDGD